MKNIILEYLIKKYVKTRMVEIDIDLEDYDIALGKRLKKKGFTESIINVHNTKQPAMVRGFVAIIFMKESIYITHHGFSSGKDYKLT